MSKSFPYLLRTSLTAGGFPLVIKKILHLRSINNLHFRSITLGFLQVATLLEVWVSGTSFTSIRCIFLPILYEEQKGLYRKLVAFSMSLGEEIFCFFQNLLHFERYSFWGLIQMSSLPPPPCPRLVTPVLLTRLSAWYTNRLACFRKCTCNM